LYKALVVDDEPRQVRTMISILKKIRPNYEIFEAYDGKEALEIVLSMPLDIVITDIKMPVMDGLELGEKICQAASNIKIVILSGYAEFEYAQKSIRFGVFDYLMKPISKNDMEIMLSRIEKSIDQMREEQAAKENLQKKLDNSLPVYFQHLMNKWVKKCTNPDELREIEAVFPFKGKGTVIATGLAGYKSIVENLSSEEADRLSWSIKFAMKSTLNPIGHSISFFMEGNNGVMVTVLNSLEEFELLSYGNMKMLGEFISTIKAEYGVKVSIGLGDKSENVFEEAAKCFEQAYKALKYSYFAGMGSITAYSEMRKKQSLKSFNIYEREQELKDAFMRLNREKVLKIINEIFFDAANCQTIDVHNFKEHIINIVINQVKQFNNILNEEKYVGYVDSVKEKLLQCEEYGETRHIINEILSELILLNSNSDKNQIIINKCREYIEENYMEDISLESVADRFHFNSSYFSNLFKVYTGIGFSDYLIRVRIRKAQELLKDTSIKVSEVTLKVGYKDAAYFNKIFKREVGISPYKFRQISGR